ncbi:MAG: hypothetical protein ACFFA0_15385 [Promethearchaeota archaeon]
MNYFLTKLKPSVRKVTIIYSTGVILTLLSVIFFSIKGYPLVSTTTETLDIVTPPLYMIPIFFPYGILLGEAIWMWNEKQKQSRCILLFIECGIIGIMSFIRYIVGIPFSGHAILISFFLLHEAVNNKFHYLLRFLIGMITLFITAIYKILLWRDPITFLLGILLGLVLWMPGFFYRLKKF